jgi:serine/threonine-protein kinase
MTRVGENDGHVGRIFGGKYRIDRLIAKGGMGRVYRATQFPLERPVAIKILNREFQQSDPQFVKRFSLEASIAAQLAHPHTITVFDYGESDTGDLYIAMEYLEGRPLSRVLRGDGPLRAEEMLELSIQICRGLRAAHEKGIIHRDLKPGNIFILENTAEDGGRYAKVLDFGLVKLFTPESPTGNALGPNLLGEDQGELTRTGTLLGSPKYMSPEQIQGMTLDPRTDIYSFGIIMYQMVTGTAPFTGATGVDVIYKHVNHPVPPIASAKPDADCPPELEAIILRCLEKRREDRFPSMDALLERLKEAQRLVTGISIASESSSSPDFAREAVFREPIAEEMTPVAAPPDASHAPRPATSRLLPIMVAGIAFLATAAVMTYALSSQPAPEQNHELIRATPPVRIDPAPPVAAPEPVIEAPPAEGPIEQPIRKKAAKKKRPAREEEEPVLPPNYRENPY